MRKLLREASVFVLPQLVLGLRQGHLRMRFKKKKNKVPMYSEGKEINSNST